MLYQATSARWIGFWNVNEEIRKNLKAAETMFLKPMMRNERNDFGWSKEKYQ